MKSFFQRWDSWWMRDVPPHALAIFRILFATFLLIEAATYLPFTTTLFSNHSLSIGLLMQPPSPLVAWTIACTYIVALVFLLIGFLLRPAVVVLLLLQLYYWQLSFHLFPSSYHRLFFFILLTLLLGGADKTLSLRMKLARGSWTAWEAISILPQRLIAVQITATYLGAGLQKWWLPMWSRGEVLYYPMMGKWGTPLGRWLLSFSPPMWVFDRLLVATKLFETVLPFGLWWKPVRVWFFVCGFLFHFFIALFLGLWWFLAMPATYILFLDPGKVARFVQTRFHG